jgi:hypothetical protein
MRLVQAKPHENGVAGQKHSRNNVGEAHLPIIWEEREEWEAWDLYFPYFP